jgi:hypothetical protein
LASKPSWESAIPFVTDAVAQEAAFMWEERTHLADTLVDVGVELCHVSLYPHLPSFGPDLPIEVDTLAVHLNQKL